MSSQSIALYQALRADLATCVEHVELCQSPSQAAKVQLLRSIFKKLEDDRSPDSDAAAWAKFTSINDRCASWRYTPNTSIDEVLFGGLRRHLSDFFHVSGLTLELDPISVGAAGRTGPGSNQLASDTSLYHKLFDSRLSVSSPSLYSFYRALIRDDPRWLASELTREAHHGQPYIVESSKVHFVPKNADISRMICIEPTLNTFFQLGVERKLRSRLHAVFGIDLETQPDHARRLAHLGSLDGSYATIDLESASDSLSLALMRAVLPRQVFDYLALYRCASLQKDGELTTLHSFSTMGNGFTFPLQTIVFRCAVASVYDMLALTRDRDTAVFGDDIVIATEAVPLLKRLLSLMGCIVNESKSFFQGPFRESCGHDYYRGLNVRGVYVKKLRTFQDYIVAINQVSAWSLKWCALPRFLDLLIHLAYAECYPLQTRRPSSRDIESFIARFAVPIWESDDAGFKYLMSKLPGPTGVFNYRAFVSKPRRVRVLCARGFDLSWSNINRTYNPVGAWLAFLYGEVQDGILTVRPYTTEYRTKKRVAPSWHTLNGWLPA